MSEDVCELVIIAALTAIVILLLNGFEYAAGLIGLATWWWLLDRY